MNISIITGRLTSDPEIKTTPNGVQIASFTLAVNRNFKNVNGEREADFIRCIAFKKTAELLGQYTHKGSHIAVNGRIQTRSYDNQQGQKVYITEVVVNELQFLDSKQDNQQNSYQPNQQNTQQTYQPNNYQQQTVFNQQNQSFDSMDDDMPF